MTGYMRHKNIETTLDDIYYTGPDIGIYMMSFKLCLIHFFGYMESLINILRPRQNDRTFAEDTFKCILL